MSSATFRIDPTGRRDCQVLDEATPTPPPRDHTMLPQVLLVLHGTSTARTSVGRRVELYHVALKHKWATKEAKVRYKTLRKYLGMLGALDNQIDELDLPPKHPLRSSSNKVVVDSRVRQFRACFHILSATVLSNAQVDLLHDMMNEANETIRRFKGLGQHSGNDSNGRTEPSTEVSEDDGRNNAGNNDTRGAPSNAALPRPSQLQPYENAFAALNKARKSNNDAPIDRPIEPQGCRTTTSAELSDYLKRLADDMLMELHATTPYRSNTIRLPPRQSTANRQTDARLEYTEADAAYLERLAMESWAQALNDGEILIDDDVPNQEDSALRLDRDEERTLEADEMAKTRGNAVATDDQVIHDMAHLYFANYYDSDEEGDDFAPVKKGKTERPIAKAKGDPASRASMSQVLQGYIDDMYYGDVDAPPTGRRPSISITA